MSVFGVSGGCWYPLAAIDTPELVASVGAGVMEFFVNTDSEISPGFIREFRNRCDGCGVKVYSLHPYTSFAEPRLFFSKYGKLCDDAIDYYERYFEACSVLGAKVVNFHGAHPEDNVSVERYAQVYSKLFDRAEKYGVVLAQENVRKYLSGKLDFLLALSDILGDRVRFTFDVKQANAEGLDITAFAKRLADKTVLVHISDFTVKDFCLLPFSGSFDIPGFISEMKNNGYDGCYMTEVYSHCYKTDGEIAHALSLLKAVTGGKCL